MEVCKTCEVKTIQAAVDMAEDGDILRIKSGTYKEHDISIIDKSLTIIGEGLPVIDAEMEGTAISIRAENFSIEGLKIINVGRSHTNDFAGILVSNSKNFEVKNNRLNQVFLVFFWKDLRKEPYQEILLPVRLKASLLRVTVYISGSQKI